MRAQGVTDYKGATADNAHSYWPMTYTTTYWHIKHPTKNGHASRSCRHNLQAQPACNLQPAEAEAEAEAEAGL